MIKKYGTCKILGNESFEAVAEFKFITLGPDNAEYLVSAKDMVTGYPIDFKTSTYDLEATLEKYGVRKNTMISCNYSIYDIEHVSTILGSMNRDDVSEYVSNVKKTFDLYKNTKSKIRKKIKKLNRKNSNDNKSLRLEIKRIRKEAKRF